MGRSERLVMVLLELLLHGVLDLVGVLEVHGHHAKGVADEIDCEVILHDLGEAAEQGRLVRIFDVALEGDDPLGLHGLGQKEQEGEQVLVVGSLPLGSGEDLGQAAADALDDIQGAADQERGYGCAHDGAHLVGRGGNDHVHLAAGDDVEPEHADEEQDNADDLEHASGACSEPSFIVDRNA